jgi:hypothetical protein
MKRVCILGVLALILSVGCDDSKGNGDPATDNGTPSDSVAATDTAGDATAPPEDSGTPPQDSGTPPEDTGTPPEDTGAPPEDAADPEDTVVQPGDAVSPADVPTADNGSPPAGQTLTAIFDPIFQAKGCTAGYCHGASAGELQLQDVDSIYANLVNQTAAAAACGLTQRVVPGEPENSLLWHRVKPLEDGEEPCVAKMPKGSDGLTADEAQLVYDWIKGGAQK